MFKKCIFYKLYEIGNKYLWPFYLTRVLHSMKKISDCDDQTFVILDTASFFYIHVEI